MGSVNKAVSSKAGVGTALDYVTKEEKTEEKLVSGLNCQPDTAKEEMQATKELWGKTKGRTYKHFVQSFAPDEKIDPEQAHRIACRLAAERPEWKGFEVLIATHKDKEHIHTHFIVNSVSFEDGHKLQQSKADLQNMKDASDRLCLEHGLHITEKGKTFAGQEREETTAFKKDMYQLLKKAENGEVKSYVQDIALAVMDCRETAASREDFCRQMKERGFEVDWQDNHKYITFIDISRQEQGEKQCKVRNNKLEKYYNIDFGKEGLEHGFEVNARSQQTEQYAREQLAAHRGAEQDHSGAGKESVGAIIRELRAGERASEQERDDKIAERKDRDIERKRQSDEAKRRAEAAERAAQRRSRGYDFER